MAAACVGMARGFAGPAPPFLSAARRAVSSSGARGLRAAASDRVKLGSSDLKVPELSSTPARAPEVGLDIQNRSTRSGTKAQHFFRGFTARDRWSWEP